MQRPLMNPVFQHDQPARHVRRRRLLKLLARGGGAIVRALLLDVRPRFLSQRVRIEEGAPWQRCLRGMFYRLSCLPILLAIASSILVYAVTHPRVPMIEQDPISVGVYYDPLTFLAGDDTRIDAWLAPAIDANRIITEKDAVLTRAYPAVVLAHDFGQTMQQMLPLVKPLHDAGYVVMVVGLRGSGMGTRPGQTFGLNESLDIAAAVEVLRKRPFVDRHSIGVIGIGAGANAALLAADRDPSLRVVIVEDPISHFEEALVSRIGMGGGWTAWLNPLCRWTFEVAYQHNARDIEPRHYASLFATRSVLMLDDNPDSKRFPRAEGIAQIRSFLDRHLKTEPAGNQPISASIN